MALEALMISLMRGTPRVMFMEATPAKWKVFRVIWVPGTANALGTQRAHRRTWLHLCPEKTRQDEMYSLGLQLMMQYLCTADGNQMYRGDLFCNYRNVGAVFTPETCIML